MTRKIQNIVSDKTARADLIKDIPKLKGKTVLIVGDIGLDEYVLGEVRRISPEAPVPVLEVDKEDVRLGLAGNVAQNVQSLGGVAKLISVVGQDVAASQLRNLLTQSGVSGEFLVVDGARPTTRKTRVMAKHHHLVRVDYETRSFLAADVEQRVLASIENQITTADVVVVEDYAKGMITASLMKKLVALCQKNKKPIFVDPHRSQSASFYEGVDLIKPNFDEAMVLSGLNYDDLRDSADRVYEVGEALMKKTAVKNLVMTRGKDGMTIFSGGDIHQVPTFARQVFDVTGAGDTVIATLALAYAAGLGLPKASMLANFAAGVVVGQVGCVSCSTHELKEYIETIQ